MLYFISTCIWIISILDMLNDIWHCLFRSSNKIRYNETKKKNVLQITMGQTMLLFWSTLSFILKRFPYTVWFFGFIQYLQIFTLPFQEYVQNNLCCESCIWLYNFLFAFSYIWKKILNKSSRIIITYNTAFSVYFAFLSEP